MPRLAGNSDVGRGYGKIMWDAKRRICAYASRGRRSKGREVMTTPVFDSPRAACAYPDLWLALSLPFNARSRKDFIFMSRNSDTAKAMCLRAPSCSSGYLSKSSSAS